MPDTSVTAYDVIIDGLTAGQTYFVRVGGQNSVPFQGNVDGTTNQNFEVSSVASVSPADVSPDAPVLADVRRLSATAIRAWIVPPARVGGQAVDSYSVAVATSSDMADANTTTTLAADLPAMDDTLAFDIDDLTPGIVYYVTVFATSTVGDSAVSATVGYAVPAAHPGEVDAVTVASETVQSTPITSADVAWTSTGLDEFGASIESYTVEWWRTGMVSEVQTLSLIHI